MKILDCFIFNDEIEILDIRFNVSEINDCNYNYLLDI